MKEEPTMNERMYHISDVVKEEYIRFPVCLLAEPKYRELSLEAKMIYSLLLNRLTLSQRNGWINEKNEVYLIYTREDAAETLNLSYKKTIAAFKELIAAELLLEQRQGRGYPNLLYLLKAEVSDENAKQFCEDFEQEEPANQPVEQTCQNGTSRPVEIADQELPESHIKTCQNGSSRGVKTAVQDLPESHPRKNKIKKIEKSELENSRSVPLSSKEEKRTDGRADDLQDIFDKMDWTIFRDNISAMFRQAIERLYYSEKYKIGNAVLPRETIRSYLRLLNEDILISVLDKMKANGEHIVNPTGYLMSTIFNTICEQDSDVILSLPPDYLTQSDFYTPPGEGG